MKNIFFKKGNLNQWHYFYRNKTKIWIAGYKTNSKCELIFNLIKDFSIIDVKECKKILGILGNHFGLVIINPMWSFAAVDYSRSYPIFWSKSNYLLLGAQAKSLNGKLVDQEQLTAFRMSGYTIDNGTLWKNIKGLNAGSFLFYDYGDKFFIKKYFNYIPYENNKISYSQYKIKLKKEIDKMLKNLIKTANGETIIIPLSAGLDSRLIASGLRHFKYKNVKCFSYGIKNNYEAIASEKISNKLGYKWTFVNITHSIAKKFYKSINYNNYLKNSADGVATSTIQGLLAIDALLQKGFIKKKDIVINGNSGDFISGGHIFENIAEKDLLIKDIDGNINNITKDHFNKHYSLWNTLKTNKNEHIIKNKLAEQATRNIKQKAVPLYSLLEYLEYENRQTKYVVNCQRIYDFYNLHWLIPLWNKSFIKFWEQVPLKYKLGQKLYKDTLLSMNYGNVWTSKFNVPYSISPKSMIFIRFFFKAFFFLIGKKKWRHFEKKYLNYWSENIYGFSSVNYFSFIMNKNIARNYVSFYTLLAEKYNLGFDWQNLGVDWQNKDN